MSACTEGDSYPRRIPFVRALLPFQSGRFCPK